ncbi:hypothetical protein L6Q96_14870 [Candidatus Binatia bacterium]|nr:hypothetical protein [Candidatus Binatia bacterium]
MGHNSKHVNNGLFQPDVILPGQFLARRGVQAHGERHLMLAVLEDGINCFRDNLLATRESERRIFREAEEWIMGEEQVGPFSFLEICHVLGLDPDYLREGLERWRQRQLRAVESHSHAA